MRRAFTVGDDGLNSFDWSCPVDAPVGSYQLDVRLPGGNARSGASPVLGSARARVEEFQPDTLALAASFSPAAPKGWIRTGQDAPAVEAQARLDNLYGEPAGNHRVQATLRTEKSRLHFAGFEDYTFYEPAGFEGEGQSQDLPAAFTDSKGIPSTPPCGADGALRPLWALRPCRWRRCSSGWLLPLAPIRWKACPFRA